MEDAVTQKSFAAVETSPRRPTAYLVAVLMSIGSITATGCSPVAPYERAKLAHPTMGSGDMTGFGEAHLRAINEGATGGSSGTGSGCGCN
jgi:hypothetical protein